MQISYLVLIVVSLCLGLGTQAYIRSTYNRWSKVPLGIGLSGRQMSREMLDEAGLQDVPIENNGKADLSDYYDPRKNALFLSGGSDRGASVASAAVACHEAGHAVQHAKGYGPARLRLSLVPIVNFGEQTWIIVLLLGVMFNITGLINLGIFLFAFVVIFELVTLPVEFDASKRAIAYISSVPGVSSTEASGARQVLTAAALTYVAAALSSILQLLYLLGQRRD
jgi:Zn-dependent membrane protease YugP